MFICRLAKGWNGGTSTGAVIKQGWSGVEVNQRQKTAGLVIAGRWRMLFCSY